MMEDAYVLLKKYWSYDAFRAPQAEIVADVLAGKDVMAVLPTGAGKSLCYQLPALMLDGITIVVSPLIALMEDQVAHLNKLGIAAAYIHSGMDAEKVQSQYERLKTGSVKLLYVAPERLLSKSFLEEISQVSISLLAIDEAHCISAWGHDFRPAYRKIGEFLTYFDQLPIIALTASATNMVKADIQKQLKLEHASYYQTSVIRENLSYQVEYQEAKLPRIAQLYQKQPFSSIIYCGTRKNTVSWAEELGSFISQRVYFYHAGMLRAEKEFVFTQWSSKTDSIITATSAFGMGIDKADVRTVFHADLPTSLEQYYQEVGRAGRDGGSAKGVLLYNEKDIAKLELYPEQQFPDISFVKAVYVHLMDYLNIGVGDGAERSKAFDITQFVKAFQLPMLPTLSAMRILEQEGFWIWQEDAKTQYTVMLTTTRTHLNYLEKNFPDLFAVVEVLLRHHGSVFYFDTAIQIFELSKVLRIDKTIFEQRLYQLEDMGILRYRPAIVGSFIYFVEERLDVAYLNINQKALALRKADLEAKISSLSFFIQNQQFCRNVMLAQYFGEEDVKIPCGKCDNCLRQKNKKVSRDHQIAILELLNHRKSLEFEQLVAEFDQLTRAELIQIVRDLVGQGKAHWREGSINI